MQSTSNPGISCLGGCGKSWSDEEGAMMSGSEFLAVARAWRCGECTRGLSEASMSSAEEQPFVDKLNPASRGALPKETASTITEPRVAP